MARIFVTPIQLNTATGTDAILSESGIDRSSASAETFNIQNSGAGAMTLQVDGSTVWHAGNDGSGSGLDADLLDGVEGSGYLRNGLVNGIPQILNINRSDSAATGIQFYDNAYKTWAMYMGPAAGGSAGPSGDLTIPTGTYVTSWGIRNYIEDSAGYGWTWESGTGPSDTTPAIVAELSSNTGTFRTTGPMVAPGFANTEGSGLRLTFPGGGARASTSASETGAIKIKFPTATYAADNSMIRMTVEVFEYSAGKSRTFYICGYSTTVGNGVWHNVSAYEVGDSSAGPLTIRYGDDGTSNCVWIGETSTVWEYPQIFVTEVQIGYTGVSLPNWDNGWAISIVTSFDTVNESRAAVRQWNANNDGPGSGLDADLLDGQHGSFYQNAGNLNAGTLPAARMPALTGDVTTSVGTVATTIATDVVTNTKLANMVTQTFKGRNTAGTGDPEDLSIATAKTMLNLAGTNSGDQTITLTGDVTGSGTGSFATTIANNVVTNAKAADMATQTIKGRNTAGTGDPEDLSVATVKTMIGLEGFTDASNTGFGDEAANSITSGIRNTGVGVNALTAVSIGNGNTAVGDNTLVAVVNASDNTAVGSQALQANTGSNNTAVGSGSMVGATSSGSNNTAVGTSTLAATSYTGSGATAIGYHALIANTASNNTAVGSLTLGANTSGTNNTAVGASALGAITTNSNCTAVGNNALVAATGGTNSGFGTNAGNTITTGTGNTCIGYNSDVNSSSSINRTVVGQGAVGTVNNAVQLGDSSTTQGFIGSTGIMLQGKHHIPIMAAAMRPSTTSGCTGPSFVETTTNDVMIGYMEFANGSTTYAHFSMPFDKSWNQGTITYKIGWYSPATTGNVVWSLQGVAVSDNDPLDAAWGTGVNVTDGVTAAGDMLIASESAAVTIGGTPAEGDQVYFRVSRVGGDAADTSTGVARLLWVKLYVTYDAGNDA